MLRIRLFVLLLALSPLPAFAQFVAGQLLTAAQLNAQFGLYLPKAGGTMTGALTVPSLSVSGALTLAAPLDVNSGGTGLATIPQYGTVVGNGTGSVTAIAPGAAGTLYGSNGASANPSFQTLGALGVAPLASPAFSGVPAAPTASAGTSSSQIASTAFVVTEVANANIGITSGTNAAAGRIGEVLSNTTTGTAIVSATAVNATNIGLTAGDWLCYGAVSFVPAASTVISYPAVSINTTSATLAAFPNTTNLGQVLATGTNGLTTILPPLRRVNVSAPTTVYLVAYATTVAASTATVSGYLECRRMR